MSSQLIKPIQETEHIADFFRHVAWKHLRMVDLPGGSSNQHEIGAVAKLRHMLGMQRRENIKARWRIFDNEGNLVETIEYNNLTWYDCREKQPHRKPEWRLYYPAGITPLQESHLGDLLLISQPGPYLPAQQFDLLFYVIPHESSLHNEVLWALGIDKTTTKLNTIPNQKLRSKDVPILQRDVLQLLEPELKLSSLSFYLTRQIEESFEDFIKDPLTKPFPSTIALAQFAIKNATISPVETPDQSLIELLDIESRTFYALERALLEKRLATGFEQVDNFISFSLSVQNRRKARRGRSLENHLSFIFKENDLRFEEQVKTERSSVDFLFPGLAEYILFEQNETPPVMMLAAKSTCKDRWRQVLNEALALKRRYLFTLEAAISSNQTAEMHEASLSLVVPESIISSFENPKTEILSLKQYIALVKSITT